MKIGSLSYAEDDGKHVLGIKTPAADESQGYCCHVLECADEVCAHTDIYTCIKFIITKNISMYGNRQYQKYVYICVYMCVVRAHVCVWVCV